MEPLAGGNAFTLLLNPCPKIPGDSYTQAILLKLKMTVYRVQLVNQELGLDYAIAVPAGEYILDLAEANQIRLPSGCKQGNCSACVAKLVVGAVDQSEQSFLRPEEIAAGYILTCVATPLADCLLETHQEKHLYQASLYFSQKVDAG